jgi:hypothetical protein
VLGDDEFFEQYRATIGLLKAAARARGVPVPPIAGPVPPTREPRRADARRPDVGT